MGRKKIEVQKIEDRNKRMATFRKRCGGLFKKADEIHRLTGAEVHLKVAYCGRQYYLKRIGGSIPNPKLKVMEYTPQRAFRACVSPPIKENEVYSNTEADTTTSSSTPVQSDDSEPVTYTMNAKGDRVEGESCKELLKEICSCLQYIVRDEVYRRSRENSALLKAHHAPQPVTSTKIVVQHRECQTNLDMEPSGPVVSRGVQLSHLQPVNFIGDQSYISQTSLGTLSSDTENLCYNPHVHEASVLHSDNGWVQTSCEITDSPEPSTNVVAGDPKEFDGRTSVLQVINCNPTGLIYSDLGRSSPINCSPDSSFNPSTPIDSSTTGYSQLYATVPIESEFMDQNIPIGLEHMDELLMDLCDKFRQPISDLDNVFNSVFS